MGSLGAISLIIIVINCLVSYRGFTNKTFFESYQLDVDSILIRKDYKRLVTSGFLHLSWPHLVFNMLSLVFFSDSLENYLGGLQCALIYFVSLVGGGLFILLVHRHHGDYSAVGASGAVCGIIFSSIALFPGMNVGLFLIPLSIPGWIYGLLFIAYSIYGVRSRKGNIGHEAHLGGALVGMFAAIVMVPSALIENYVTILVISIPTIIFTYLVITRPHVLLVDNFFFKKHHAAYNIDQRYNLDRTKQQQEIDRILDKINTKGMSSLTKAESNKLKEYSKKM